MPKTGEQFFNVKIDAKNYNEILGGCRLFLSATGRDADSIPGNLKKGDIGALYNYMCQTLGISSGNGNVNVLENSEDEMLSLFRGEDGRHLMVYTSRYRYLFNTRFPIGFLLEGWDALRPQFRVWLSLALRTLFGNNGIHPFTHVPQGEWMQEYVAEQVLTGETGAEPETFKDSIFLEGSSKAELMRMFQYGEEPRTFTEEDLLGFEPQDDTERKFHGLLKDGAEWMFDSDRGLITHSSCYVDGFELCWRYYEGFCEMANLYTTVWSDDDDLGLFEEDLEMQAECGTCPDILVIQKILKPGMETDIRKEAADIDRQVDFFDRLEKLLFEQDHLWQEQKKQEQQKQSA